MKNMQNEEVVRSLYSQMCSLEPISQNTPDVLSGTPGMAELDQTPCNSLTSFFMTVHGAMPGCECRIDDLIALDDKVMVRYTISGTQEGRIMGMEPTHQVISIKGLDIFRVQNGKIIEYWDGAHQFRTVQRPESEGLATHYDKSFAEKKVSNRKLQRLNI